MDDIAARAAEWGLETEYHDARGARRVVPAEVLRRLLTALEGDGRSAPLAPHPVLIWRRGRTSSLEVPNSRIGDLWALHAGGSTIATGVLGPEGLALPDDLPLGIFRLALSGHQGSCDPTCAFTLVVAPATACQIDPLNGERLWLPAVQLYAVRSHRNWGHGDFTDLLRLVRLTADIGAAGVGVNPLHALFDDHPEQASPYSPNSRLFLNALYVDIEAVPEFPGLQQCGLEDTVGRLRATEIVDYASVAGAKTKALRAAYAMFCERAGPPRKADFDSFRTERAGELRRFAAYQTLRRRFQRVWWEWPPEWRDPTGAAIDTVVAEEPDEIGYHEFVQWLADRQLAACQTEARRLGLPIGIYADLAIGVEPAGADAWSEQRSIVPGVEVGAPPDLLNTAGQAWGLSAFNPRALQAQEFAPLARVLAATMRHAGAIRLDHVLGLNRFFLIPFGCRPQDGAYVRYPLQALLAVVAIESKRQRCVVIGEDLGTVPAEFRDVLADWGIWSYLVMLFERHGDGSFRMPADYRRNALVTFNTHDLPAFAGWRTGHDLRVKAGLGLDPGESADERAGAHAAMGEALSRLDLGGDSPLSFPNVLRFLARTPSRMLVVAIEDILGVADQPNVPGTVFEHPNWRRRLPVDVEDLASHPGLQAVASALAQEGRRTPPPDPGTVEAACNRR